MLWAMGAAGDWGARRRLRALTGKVTGGEIAAKVARVYHFEDLYQAMEHVERASWGGKILLRFNQG